MSPSEVAALPRLHAGTAALANVLAHLRDAQEPNGEDTADASLARAWMRERGWDVARGRGAGAHTDDERAGMLAGGLADARGHRAVQPRDRADAERALMPLRAAGFDVVRGVEG